MSLSCIELQKGDGIGTVRLARGKVNAINPEMVAELHAALKSWESDPDVRSLLITGNGKFFSFGFDIPELLPYDRESFTRFVVSFGDLITYLFLYPKPVIAGIDGHAVAGGCMLALACDYRVMVPGKAKISLNEITFASTIFASAAEHLRFCAGNANAQRVLLSGSMFDAEEAASLGLIDAVSDDFTTPARELGAKSLPAYANMKSLLRAPVVDEYRRRELQSIREFVEIWYSPGTRANLQKITIR